MFVYCCLLTSLCEGEGEGVTGTIEALSLYDFPGDKAYLQIDIAKFPAIMRIKIATILLIDLGLQTVFSFPSRYLCKKIQWTVMASKCK